ncbi:MAG: class I SAM-dependent methyltransferase [Candidatus Thiodiazotropha lotti]|nr:class I SAM-dependent methyltransferase [Candidatus Thiodiazotropha lotti]MCW4193622.1 class I SAM-dependent methyltransferase [Candidatus Thiodiazotropha lotti]
MEHALNNDRSMDTTQYKQTIQSTFDKVSSRYDQNSFFGISAKRLARLLPAADGLQVLDISTGTGSVAIEVAINYPDAQIEAIDLSREMLEFAAKKVQQMRLPNIRFIQSDVDELTYPADRFDVVTCGYAMFFYPDMEASYRAICKTVKPGGQLIGSSFTNTAFNPYAELFLDRLKTKYDLSPPGEIKDRLKTAQNWQALVESSDYTDLEIIEEPIRYPVSVDEWWGLLNSAGYKSLLDQLKPEQLEAFKREHTAEVTAISDNGTIELNTDTLFCRVTL